jgi:hypothetical protein
MTALDATNGAPARHALARSTKRIATPASGSQLFASPRAKIEAT